MVVGYFILFEPSWIRWIVMGYFLFHTNWHMGANFVVKISFVEAYVMLCYIILLGYLLLSTMI